MVPKLKTAEETLTQTAVDCLEIPDPNFKNGSRLTGYDTTAKTGKYILPSTVAQKEKQRHSIAWDSVGLSCILPLFD